MKTTQPKQLLSLTLILFTCNVFGLKADPPTCKILVDYAGTVTQLGSSATTLALSGSLQFDINKITSTTEFDDFVTRTTIVVKHAGTADNSKTLKAYLQQADPSYLTTKKTAAVAAKAIVGYNLPLSLLNVLKDDQVVITCQVKAGLLTKPVTLKITDDTTAGPVITETQKSKPNLTVDAALKTYLDGDGGTVDIDGISLGQIMHNESRYDKEGNKAYLVVDQNGELIDNYPVNIDQDDIVYVIIVGKKDKIEGYTADYTGTYAPVDLQMRSFTPIDTGFHPNGVAPYNAKDYTVVYKKRGPFTSANVIVKVKDNASEGAILATYTLTVNTLFHLGFGVAFNRTSLENPDYIVSPLNGTQNTIVKTNDGNRNLVSVNVIWYWSSTFKYITRGDNITRGRDVLKEPNFLERINPTFGVGLSGKMTDNMFAGLTFEFARGGSIFGGYHFGMVKRLVDPTPGFNIGKDVFTGTAADIKTSNVSNKDWAFGIILDTRILNALFKRGS